MRDYNALSAYTNAKHSRLELMNETPKEPNVQLDDMLDDFLKFCKENAVPVFVATWDKNRSENAGYMSREILPEQLGIDIHSYSIKDKFPLFVRIASGEEDSDE